jgi:hypothetical protein
MAHLEGCQLPSLPEASEVLVQAEPQPLVERFKRALAAPWNQTAKPLLKRGYRLYKRHRGRSAAKRRRAAAAAASATTTVAASAPSATSFLKAGDLVRVRSHEEIRATLDPWKELRGCAFLDSMSPYCGTTQRVLKIMERFLDERDYKVKKVRGMVLLEGILCPGTPVFGRCDRCCHFFWREEWLEKLESKGAGTPSPDNR